MECLLLWPQLPSARPTTPHQGGGPVQHLPACRHGPWVLLQGQETAAPGSPSEACQHEDLRWLQTFLF